MITNSNGNCISESAGATAKRNDRAGNMASRLESKAITNQIIISKSTFERVKDKVENIYLGKIELNGISGKVDIWEVTDLKVVKLK